jgi:hypothetical protein
MRFALARGHAAQAQAQRDVGEHVQPGHQGVLLEHHATVGARTGDRAAVEQDLAARGRQEPGQAVQQRGLAAARCAQGDDEVAVAHGSG